MATVLQRVERYEKTGLLILKNQDAQEIDFYLHEGRLLCIGPVRTKASLGDRLLQDGVISSVVLRETMLVLGNVDPGESLMARKLMDLHYVSRDELRAWAIQKAVDVLNVVLAWPTGNVYFEEDTLPPSDRLLVSMSISSLLASASPVAPTLVSTPSSFSEYSETTLPPISQPLAPVAPEPVSTPNPDVASMPTMSGSQFIDDTTFSASSLMDAFAEVDSSLPTTKSFAPFPDSEQLSPFLDGGMGVSADVAAFPSFFSDGDAIPLTPASAALYPVRVLQPTPPRRIDTSFMQPDMLLAPSDLSEYRDQNPQVQLTPEQWQVLSLIDGRHSLQEICQLLNAPGELLRDVAGELIAERLVYIALSDAQQMQGVSSLPQELTVPGMANSYVAPGHPSATASPWSTSLPAVASPPAFPQPFASTFSVPTEAQWGNGENGAAFIPGQGWVMNSQHMQSPFQAENAQHGVYASAGTGY
ncbi:MAG: hypothetical protein H0U76_28945 [Ktedonobacteraceae bacterium]|nr:hypothetical protein [Ktedonobacteraceae bacterium]